MESSFESSPETIENRSRKTPRTKDTSADFSPSDSVGNFLFQISSFMRKTSGNAKLMIFESRMRLIYPRDELEREMITPLASDFKKYILENETSLADSSTELKSSDGQSYLLDVYKRQLYAIISNKKI